MLKPSTHSPIERRPEDYEDVKDHQSPIEAKLMPVKHKVTGRHVIGSWFKWLFVYSSRVWVSRSRVK
ncbi:hypothetical protein HanHA89_Chr02g0050761 [Helianthus annuus]|nr:hypothetical protein HanHA89_Chr02g0050761 [Helianthus annuus]